MKGWLRIALGLMLAVLALDASPPAGAAELAELQILRRGNGAEPGTLDPQKVESVPDFNIVKDLFEGLLTEGAKGELLPGAAQNWEISADRKVYTFHLWPNAEWSNGAPLTAGDFVYGMRRAVDPKVGSKYSFVLYPILNAEAVTNGRMAPDALGVEALDDHTLRLTLHAPTPYILALLVHPATYPAYRPAIERYGSQFTHPGNLVSDGPFRLAAWIPQSKVVLKKNPYFWQAAQVRLARVDYVPIENSGSELIRYRGGGLEMTSGVPLDQLGWIKTHLAAELRVAPYLGTSSLGFNQTRPPFKGNVKLRQALSLALDRRTLIDKILLGDYIPAYSWVPPYVAGYDTQAPDAAHLTQEQRDELARKLYAEAGYGPGKPLNVQILYSTNENTKRLMVAIAAMWKTVLGLDVTLINEEFKVYLENRKLMKETEVFADNWIGDYDDANTFLELLRSDGGLNNTGFVDPKYDDLLDQAANSADLATRKALFETAERIMLADQPLAPLFFYISRRLVKPYVLDYADNPENHHPSRWLAIAQH
jgi:oligopeptide transport system substrate-binding protein